MITCRENIIRAIRFERPEYIPMEFHINPSCWHHYDQNILQDLMEAHPFLFPNFVRQKEVKPHYALNQFKDTPYTDPWGCVWKTTDDGITGSVVQHSLENWSKLNQFSSPDPNVTDGTHPIDWDQIRSDVVKQRKNRDIISGGLPHGHTFLRLLDIRGYQNLMFDMLEEDPNLEKLIKLVEDFNYQYVLKWLELAPDIMTYPEDLGMQVGPMLAPESFRRYILPVYSRLMKPARDHGCLIHMHSDGDIRVLAEYLLKAGVDVLNIQDIVNGVDWIAATFAGRLCIDLDVDRQNVTPHGSPEQIDALIKDEIVKLGRKEGGLMMIYGLYPGVPIENIKALMDAMEKYSTYFKS